MLIQATQVKYSVARVWKLINSLPHNVDISLYVFSEFLSTAPGNDGAKLFLTPGFSLCQKCILTFAAFILLYLQLHIYFCKHIFQAVGGN